MINPKEETRATNTYLLPAARITSMEILATLCMVLCFLSYLIDLFLTLLFVVCCRRGEATGDATMKIDVGGAFVEDERIDEHATTAHFEDNLSDPDASIAPFEGSLEDDQEEENAQEIPSNINKRHRTLFVVDDEEEI